MISVLQYLKKGATIGAMVATMSLSASSAGASQVHAVATAGNATGPLLIIGLVLVVGGVGLLLGARGRRARRGRHATGGLSTHALPLEEQLEEPELRGRDSNSQPHD